MRQKSSVCPETLLRYFQHNFSCAIRKPHKILLLSPYLNFSRPELNDKIFISFLYCVLVCVCCRPRCERGRTRRRAVPRASVRPQTRRTVPWSGLPGRLWERQVQSHPLMHVLSQFYKHNSLACFTKLHMFWLLKTWLDSHPLICYNHSLTTKINVWMWSVWTLIAARMLRTLNTIQLGSCVDQQLRVTQYTKIC